MKKVTLVGGTNDSRVVEIHGWQRVVSVGKRMTMAEVEALRIDDVQSWQSPQEVYERFTDGNFYYIYTHHHKPDDFFTHFEDNNDEAQARRRAERHPHRSTML